GFGLEVEDHMWFEDGHAYEMTPDVATLTRRYVENQEDVLTAALQCGISGSVYTQITDVEHEVNGFFTYDRQVEKMDFGQVREVNESIIAGADGSGGEPPVVDPGTPGLSGVHAWAFDEGSGTNRKSTRLNSSHVKISYAVFCLKKKKNRKDRRRTTRPRQSE